MSALSKTQISDLAEWESRGGDVAKIARRLRAALEKAIRFSDEMGARDNQNMRLKKEIDAVKARFDRLERAIRDQRIVIERLERENAELRSAPNA